LASKPDIVTILLGTNDAKVRPRRYNGDAQAFAIPPPRPCSLPQVFNWNGQQAPPTSDNFTADYLSLIAVYKALPTNPKVYVVLPPPLYPPFPYDMSRYVINDVRGGTARRCVGRRHGSEGTRVRALFRAAVTSASLRCLRRLHLLAQIYPELLRSIAAAGGADGVIDVFDALGGANLSQPNITCDGCHPRDAGYAEIAATIAAAIAGKLRA
jgi:lysophospholipase L1-like esterase